MGAGALAGSARRGSRAVARHRRQDCRRHTEPPIEDEGSAVPSECVSYYEEARARARRRKSAWNLLLIPAVVLPIAGFWRLVFLLAARVHVALYPDQTWGVHSAGLGVILTVVAPFFAAIPVGLYVGNITVWLIRPARRVLDREAEKYEGTDFQASQRQLLVAMLYVVPPALALAILGVFLPWYV